MTGFLIAGTSSDAGKSLVTTGICRALRRRGFDVAPFKAQNMSNNSMICADGSEIGRAQYLQAMAAGVEPTSALNPVLLKPGSDRRSFIVLRGRPGGILDSGQYATGRKHLAEAAFAAYEELAAAHDIVITEGAGSPAEVNLRDGDYVNMGLAREFNLPVVIVGDIDRGGVLASVFGTWGLVRDDDRPQLAGYVINKFRGDASILAPGLDDLSARTGLRNLGVLPWLRGVWLDGEDSLSVDRWRNQPDLCLGVNDLRVGVVRFPRISNATDVEALAHTVGVQVEMTDDPHFLAAADLLVLPGSRSTVHDLTWLREHGLDEVVSTRARAGRPVLGVCGGYQMLAEVINDTIESGAGEVPGLGLLPVSVDFADAKTTQLSVHHWNGHEVHGYEIHHGQCTRTGQATAFLDGWQVGEVYGTMLHGSLENDAFRLAFLRHVAEVTGSPWRPDESAVGYAAARERMINTLADACEENLDLDTMVELAAQARRRGVRHEAVEKQPSDTNTKTTSAGSSADEAHSIAQPTTWSKRNSTRLIVHTGDGKGKTTAAMGIGLRGWAQGWNIGIFQFIKAGRWPTGERLAFTTLAAQHRFTGVGGEIEWVNLGAGRTKLRPGQTADQARLAREGWELVRRRLSDGGQRLIILDEFNHVLNKGWLDVDEVVEVLNGRGDVHVVCTGRNAPQQLIDAADLVTTFDKIKHPFDKGERGQAGIEW